MSESLDTTAAIIALSLGRAAMGSVPALATDPLDDHIHPSYAGPVSLHGYYYAHHASAEEFVPGPGVLSDTFERALK
jgi:hypothetical protein